MIVYTALKLLTGKVQVVIIGAGVRLNQNWD